MSWNPQSEHPNIKDHILKFITANLDSTNFNQATEEEILKAALLLVTGNFIKDINERVFFSKNSGPIMLYKENTSLLECAVYSGASENFINGLLVNGARPDADLLSLVQTRIDDPSLAKESNQRVYNLLQHAFDSSASSSKTRPR